MADMDIYEVLKHLPQRYPLLMIDRVKECEPGKRVLALKNVSANEPYFQGHFPSRPIMPGVMILEAMAQAAGLVGQVTRVHPFVSEVTLRFLKSGYLEHCFAEGGWLDFTVDYHFPIPSDQPYESGDWREHTVPFELSSQVSHVVPPREYEKLRVTVGPEWASEGMNTWYGVFEAVLEHDDGQLLETGPIAALGPFAYTSLRHAEDGGTGDIPGCMDRIVAVAGEAFNAPELVRSREVAELSEFLGLD
jgi:hypothetical protein